mmetsp:Transcript_13819/g.20588  ORF Transcript_13819/g.20588 Transcript_13819/m.20588 type:complete len:1015 (+) Transcript_13819:152-3196(+)
MDASASEAEEYTLGKYNALPHNESEGVMKDEGVRDITENNTNTNTNTNNNFDTMIGDIEQQTPNKQPDPEPESALEAVVGQEPSKSTPSRSTGAARSTSGNGNVNRNGNLGAGAALANMPPLKKYGIIAVGIAALSGFVFGLTQIKSSDENKATGMRSGPPPAPQEINLKRLSYFDSSVLAGYADTNDANGVAVEGSGCESLKEDLYEAVEILTNATIDQNAISKFHNEWYFPCHMGRGGGMVCGMSSNMREDGDMIFMADGDMAIPEAMPMETVEAPMEDTGTSEGTTDESSFGTNNQVEAVDEADLVKSDGDYVFAAYGTQLVVWNSITGEKLSTTQMPTFDEDGNDLCTGKDVDSSNGGGGIYYSPPMIFEDVMIDVAVKEGTDTKPELDLEPTVYPCYMKRYSWSASNRYAKIQSMLLHEDRLLVIASVNDLVLYEDTKTPSEEHILQGYGQTRSFLYDISDGKIPSDGDSPLAFLASKDLTGRYQTARSLGQHGHIVTSSSLDMWRLDRQLSPWEKEFDPLEEEEYRSRAYEKSLVVGKEYVDMLLEELSDVFGDGEEAVCANIAKVALMVKPISSDGEDDTANRFPSFTSNTVLQTLTQVHSIDMLQVDVPNTVQEGVDLDLSDTTGGSDAAAAQTPLESTTAGAFFPITSYTSNIYASADKLVIAGESYEENDEGVWKEHTIFLVYDIVNGGSTTSPSAVGRVPGSLLNQFSMDHYVDGDVDYLRVATTTWGQWGVVDDIWQQTETSESSVYVMKMTSFGNENEDDDGGAMEIVGSVNEIGLGERIYAVRFVGVRGYVVTFRQIDPFYTLNLSDPTAPEVVGELKIPGFSNYLHPISDELILGLGQDADENGSTNGLQISLFDVSDFAKPKQVRKYTEDNKASSAAQYDHRAFRYLPESKLLILPLSTPHWNWDIEGIDAFDGFVVYDVDESKDFKQKFNISHFDSGERTCWGEDTLPSRSLVFNGDVTTLKGHKVYSSDLDTGEVQWDINLDKGREEGDGAYCMRW